MNKDINIRPKNNKGQRHGYWEYYWTNGNLAYKGLFHNDKHVGYEEWYDWIYGYKITEKKYYL